MSGAPASASARVALRGDLLDFAAAPEWGNVESKAVRFRPDHWLLVEGGRIVGARPEAPGEGWVRHDHAGRWILPGFIDTHVHSPQLDVIASYGTELLDWLTTHTFPAEARHADPPHTAATAALFLDALLATAPPRRWSSRPCIRNRSTPCSPPPRCAACASSLARC